MGEVEGTFNLQKLFESYGAPSPMVAPVCHIMRMQGPRNIKNHHNESLSWHHRARKKENPVLQARLIQVFHFGRFFF